MTRRPQVSILCLALGWSLGPATPVLATEGFEAAMEQGRQALERCTAAQEEGVEGVADAAGQEAAEAFSQALAAAPESVEARLGAAKARLLCRIAQAPMMEKMTLMQEIESLLNGALERQPRHWEARFLLAALLYNVPPFLGRSEHAVAHFEKLIAQQEEDGKPERAEPYLFLGDLHLRQERPEAARRIWQRGRERHPDSGAFTERLSTLPAETEETEETELPAATSLEERLRRRLEEEVAKSAVPGLAVALERSGEPLVMAGFGYADLENDVAVTPQTVFRIGSITKQITAAAILDLVEKEALSLSDPVVRWLPDSLPDSVAKSVEGITLGHLLSHTAGLPTDAAETARWIEDSLAAPRVGRPGERYHYSNLGYALLGRVLQEVGGKPFEIYVRETFFEPLGMTATQMCDPDRIIPHRAEGYTWRGDRLLNDDPLRFTPSLAYAGGLCSTLEDQVRWQRALHGGEVLGEPTYRAMIAPPTVSDPEGTTYALGMRVDAPHGRRALHHSGGITGFAAEAAYYPELDLVTVVLVNGEATNPRELSYELVEMVAE